MAPQRLPASAHAQADAVVGAAVVEHGDVVAPGFYETLLEALAGRLAKQYNLRWEPLSKFARANALK